MFMHSLALICINFDSRQINIHPNFVFMKTIEKTDPLTSEVFIPLRSNQVFANDENRIRFNNLKAKELRENKSQVDKPLLNNFRILTELMAGKQEEIFHKQFLLGRGYSFLVFTNYEDYNGKRCLAVYNYIIAPIEGDHIKIIKK